MSKTEIAILFLIIGFFIRPWVEVIIKILTNSYKEYRKELKKDKR